ncbi:MAG: Trk family potassium uptake protein [Clostridia bacterium]|nr:Trk family potassium uptake protein [Clostridia bacterium]
MKRRKFVLSPWQILAIGYLIVILIGSVLLILPFATEEGESTSYLNSLFTSVSATCVTGLVKYDTGVHWTLFGQIVILILVQIGGLGFMSFVSILFQMFGRGKGIYSRNAFLTSMGGSDLASMKSLLMRVFIGSFSCEIVGAALLTIQFIPDYGVSNGIYFAVFHSVTAFCNAGFDVMGIVGGASLSSYCTNPLVVLVICALIILGGLGFCVWGDVMDCRFHYKKFKLNTRVVLWTTLSLIVVPTILFMVFEWNNPSYVGYNFGDKLLASLFSAVTPRTAGFYTTDPATLSSSGYLLTLILMFIGGASGSTAGGIKVGTIAVVIMGMLAVFRSDKEINFGRKRIDNSLLQQALAVMTACLILVLLATMIICAVQPDLGFGNVLFECISAMGTVGLSTGITAELNVCSTIIIMILMYFGRAGILTVVYALNRRKSYHNVKYPLDTMLIG